MIKALGRYVLIKPLPKPPQTRSGLYIPDTGEITNEAGQKELIAIGERPQIAEVISVGAGYRNGKKLDIKVGDFVLFPKFHDSKIRVKQEELLWIHISELYAVLEKED